jgi:hypothetical protein
MSKMLDAVEGLRVANNLLEVAFWAAEGGIDNGEAMACLIFEGQDKLKDAVANIKAEAGIDQPEQEAA